MSFAAVAQVVDKSLPGDRLIDSEVGDFHLDNVFTHQSTSYATVGVLCRVNQDSTLPMALFSRILNTPFSSNSFVPEITLLNKTSVVFYNASRRLLIGPRCGRRWGQSGR